MYNCSDELLSDNKNVERMLTDAAADFAMEPHHCRMDHEEGSQEYSLGVMCKQGHIMMHIYPELGFATIDIFTCNTQANADGLALYLRRFFNPDKVKVTYLERGDFGSETDMKPRRRSNTKTMRKVVNAGKKFKNILKGSSGSEAPSQDSESSGNQGQ